MQKALIGILALAPAGCAHVEAGPSGPVQYVAMGSSYAAGAGIGETKPGTPERCQRAANNYATLLAERLGFELNDQGCGGATTAHLLGNWDELPPQIDAVQADTDLVTITVGGNDLNYMGHVFGESCDPAVGFTYKGKTRPCPSFELPTAADYAEVEQNLAAIGKEIHQRAPGSTVIFVQYVTLIPDTNCPALQIPDEKLADIRAIGKGLAQATRNAAKASGALVLDVDRMSINHTACDAEPWSKAAPDPADTSPGAFWHPNAAGHAAIAEALAEFLAVERIGRK